MGGCNVVEFWKFRKLVGLRGRVRAHAKKCPGYPNEPNQSETSPKYSNSTSKDVLANHCLTLAMMMKPPITTARWKSLLIPQLGLNDLDPSNQLTVALRKMGMCGNGYVGVLAHFFRIPEGSVILYYSQGNTLVSIIVLASLMEC
ncbi:hypothetical protein VP01_386g2 [Puccinia sorghi]|uniref:Uncharacterized protein n=1 Tax=Puccinia sorghi TaxID=27349 RepID=A0A0L6USY9_9BASI|nr:hypothetical protein VP01_386g2 [Puccinia sorghi]